MKYKVGEIVTITDCFHGHLFNIGEDVKIIKVNEWEGGNYRAENSDGDSWWIEDDEIEKAVSFKKGDTVRTTTEARFQRDQRSLNNLLGVIVSTRHKPYDIHVAIPNFGIVGFSEFELTKIR